MRLNLTMLVVMAGFVFTGSLTGTSWGGDLYTVRVSDGVLRKLDTETLTFTDIGPIGVAYSFGGMCWDASAEKMYLVQGRGGFGFYEVDLETAETTLIGTHGLEDLFSLAFDPVTGLVYGGQSTPTGFHWIDVSTGTAHLIGDPGINLDSLTYDPVSGQVVGAYAGPGDLYAMDLNTGEASLIYDGEFFDNGGLAYDADTGLYWLIDWSGKLYTFDPAHGFQRTLVMSGLGSHDGLSGVGSAAGCLTLEVTKLVSGESASWRVSGAEANVEIALVYGHQSGHTAVDGYAGYCADFGIDGVLRPGRVVCRKKADGAGVMVCRRSVGANSNGVRVMSQAAARGTCPGTCMSNLDVQIIE